MSKLTRLSCVFLVGLSLSACAASGVRVKPEHLSGFETGKTTPTDVIAKLGQPTSRSLSADGSQMLIYNYTAYQARPESFIPLIGPLVGGADVETSMVWLQFGPDGKLAHYTANGSAVGSGTNLTSPPTPRTPDQPSKVP